ncbi:MAG TPA: LuxR C-terminal-related transcriptional regulator [Micromonosporaceae bacterium]
MAARQREPDRTDAAAVEEVLAAARFRIPELAGFHVPRPRLTRGMARGEHLPLVLVSAPAGTGKTSLVAEWARCRGNTGWITFEDGDTAVWSLVLDGLSRMGLEVPTPAREATGCLGRQRLTSLADAIARVPQRLTLVLDGPELASLELAREIDFVLRHTLGRLRLVLVGRVDPVLPLYRYRLTDTLLEIRAADIAFTDEEASWLLRRSGVKLSAESVRDLNRRTRGWAAGLRFAALALVGQADPEQAAATVVSQANDINEYLIGEVLDAQPPEARRFLLDTCLPDVLLPGLVEELAGPGAGHTLGLLSRSNAFLEPVPDQPGAYRYYPFFRDLLRAQLAYESPWAIVDLHRRAARWFQRAALPDQAIGHLAAVGAWDEVAGHIVNGLMVGRLLLEGSGGPLSRVTLRLPDDLEQAAGQVVRAALALTNGDRTACAEALAGARLRVRAGATRENPVALSMSVLDAVRASTADDVAVATRLAEEAERALNGPRPELPNRSESELSALVRFSKGVVMLRRGDLERARRALSAAAGVDAVRSYPAFRAACLGYLAITEALEGRLARAGRTAAESLELADTRGVADRSPAARVALARIALEQYDLKSAREHVAVALLCPVLKTDPVCRTITEGVVASLERAGGQLRPALARLEVAAAGAEATDPWLARSLRVEAAKLSMASGRAELARSALEPIEQSDDPEVAAVAAAVYAEQGHDAAAADSLAQVRNGEPPLSARVTGLLVEMVWESRRRSSGRTRVVLDRSLRLAASEGLRRPFREAGPSVQRLLSADPRLLSENRWLSHPGKVVPSPADMCPEKPSGQQVVEPLTAKELEVLRHLQELLTTEEIALRMFVSVNTVRTHVRSILRKLGVSRRNAAVRKARELGLVSDHSAAAS